MQRVTYRSMERPAPEFQWNANTFAQDIPDLGGSDGQFEGDGMSKRFSRQTIEPSATMNDHDGLPCIFFHLRLRLLGNSHRSCQAGSCPENGAEDHVQRSAAATTCRNAATFSSNSAISR
jgi:hypothetical protein